MVTREMADVEAGNVKSWPQLVSRLLAAAMGFRKVYSALLVLVAWELGAIAINDRLFLPRPSDVIATLGNLAASGQLLTDIEASLTRALGGFAIAMALGVPLGIMMGRFRRWDDFWGVLISFSNPIPKIGLVPLFILWLGIGETSKVAVV